MRAHQAASSASSAREKWMRPLVVGPSPVMTPSRTMVRAWAAVSRQDGSGTPFSAALVLGADIVGLLNSLVLGHLVHAGVNEWLTIRNRRFDILRWLPICRFLPLPGSAGRDAGHTRRKRGSDADRDDFSPQGRSSKEGARTLRGRRRISSLTSRCSPKHLI